MTQLARGYSFVMYLAESAATYTIPFPFLHAEDVRVFAGDVGDAVEQSYRWTGPTSIQLAGEVPEGILVTIRRFTKRDDSLVVIQDGGQLPARDLNLNNHQLLYIIQEQIDFGVYGGSGLPGGGAGWPEQGGTTDPNLQQIIDQLMQSPVMGLLTARLGDIDETAETVLEELIRSDQTFDARRALEGNLALAETALTSLSDDVHSVATQTTELFAKYDEAAAQIVEVREALATETEARGLEVEQITAAFKDADDQVTEAITQTLQSTYATKDYAQATAQTQVEAFANGSFVNLQERFEALVDGTADPAGSWQANWTVRINAGAINGTPVIAGIGLGVDSTTGSNFIVMANRFGIVSPTYTSNGGVQQMKYPFVVGTVGGVSTVGITGQLIVDGSITADKIKTNTLSAISANMGEVNGGTFRTYQLDANGNIIDPLEFRAELTNKPGDPFPVWVGAGVKNWNNAVFAVDRSGNAKFAGTVSAQNVTDKLQTEVLVSWAGSALATDNASSATFTLPAPVRLGEVHTPVILFSVGFHNTDNNNTASATVYLQRLTGSVWTTIYSTQAWLRGNDQRQDSYIYADAPTSSSQSYRVALSDVQHGYTFFMERINGIIFGKR